MSQSIAVENAYPVIAEDFVLHLSPHEGYLRDVSTAPTAQRADMHHLNDVAAELVSRCEGTSTLGEVLAGISAMFEGEGFDMMDECTTLMSELIGEGVLELHTERQDGLSRIRGSRAYECPSHFMIELSDQCNLRCAHCYRNSTPELDTHIPTPKLMNILEQMYAHGVATVELTGGEPTMRPDFLDIFHYCASHFASVAIVTNGWFITDDWAEQMGRYNNVLVQIDLDGSTAEAHDTLRGRNGSFERAQRAARALSKHGVRFRAAMNLYQGNFDQIRETARLAKNLGANWFSFSPVSDMGRGRDADIITPEQMAGLMDIAREIESEHGKEFLRLIDEGLMKRAEVEGNCGAGWRSMVLGPDGNVRPCVMVEPDAMAFGNLVEEDYVGFLKGFNGGFFRDLHAPGPATCEGCPNRAYCQGCFARTLNANAMMHEQTGEVRCNWRVETGFVDFVKDA